jgi:hypothetical protein
MIGCHMQDKYRQLHDYISLPAIRHHLQKQRVHITTVRNFGLERKSQHYAPAQGKVTVCEWQDGSLAIEYRGQKLNWKAISEPAKEPNPPVKTESTRGRPRPNPAPDHPWRQQYQKMRVASPGSAPDVFRMADLRFALNARPTASQGFAPAAIRNTKSNQKRGHF